MILFKRYIYVSGFGLIIAILLMAQSNLYYMTSYPSYYVLRLHNWLVAPVLQWIHDKKTMHDLQVTIAQLQKKNHILLSHAIKQQAQFAYMKDTEELRSFADRYKRPGIIAHVLARSFDENDHHFLIEAGARDGVEKDMVVSYKNQLIGKVDTVYPWYSKVCLISDSKCKIAAYCPANKAHGIHEGIFKTDESELSYVSHLHSVKKGDWVLSSGEGLIFPQGFALGKVETCTQEGLYQHITVKPAYDIQQLAYCTIHSR